MSVSLVLSDYKILNADVDETNTDSDRYLIKLEKTENNFEIPDKLDLRSNNIFLEDKT